MAQVKTIPPVKIVYMNTRGQLIIPKVYREALHMLGDSLVQIALLEEGIMIIPVGVVPIRRTLPKSASLRESISRAYGRAKRDKFVEKEKIRHIIGEKHT